MNKQINKQIHKIIQETNKISKTNKLTTESINQNKK